MEAEVRRFNPDFEEPDYPIGNSFESIPSKSFFEALNRRQLSRGNADRDFEPIGSQIQGGAREYHEMPQGYQQQPSGYHQQQVKIKKVYVNKKVYVPVPVVPKEKKSKLW